MEIRNTQHYIAELTGGQSSPQIGIPEDPLLKELLGRLKPADFEYYVGHVSNFAVDTNLQVFYEFLQNASDAESEFFKVIFGVDYFLVLNNGKPFYTDSSGRKGQLKGFLTKNKGDKYDDPELIGKHGQGSKLLYDLLLSTQVGDQHEESRRENRLQKAILEELKGPIIFSWSNQDQLEQFLTQADEISFTHAGDASDDNPLLTKIMYTYYPAFPGERKQLRDGSERTLFSESEVAAFRRYANEVFEKESSLSYEKGCILFLPLGEGRSEKLQENQEQQLFSGLAASLALLPSVKRVQINGRRLERPDYYLDELFLDEAEVTSFRFCSPHNPDKFEDQISNFFAYFPITQERVGLKYIIDCKAFDIDQGRQNLDIKNEHNRKLLLDISGKLQAHFQSLAQNENREQLIAGIKCVLASNPTDDFYKVHFHDHLLEAIKEDLPTDADGSITPEKVKIKKTNLSVQLEDLGCEGYAWLDSRLDEYEEEIRKKLGLTHWGILELIQQCDDEILVEKWIQQFAPAAYQQLLTELDDLTYSAIKGISVIRFGNGQIHSLKTIEKQDTLLVLDKQYRAIGKVLEKLGLTCAYLNYKELPGIQAVITKNVLDNSQLFERISSQLNPDLLHYEDKWNLFKFFRDNLLISADKLSRDLVLFCKQSGEAKPLSHLMDQSLTIAPSGLLTPFQIKASERLFDELDAFMMKQDEIWDHLLARWDMEILPALPNTDFSSLVQDLEKLFSGRTTKRFNGDVKWILTQAGTWASVDECFYHEKLADLTVWEFSTLKRIITKYTSYQWISQPHLKVIKNIHFALLPNAGLGEVKEKLNVDSLELSAKELRLLYDIHKPGERFFNSFTIDSTERSGIFQLEQKVGGVKQYFSRDWQLNEFLSEKDQYQLLPTALYDIFQGDPALYLDDNDQFVSDLLNTFHAQAAFIDLVSQRGAPIKKRYIREITPLELLSEQDGDNYGPVTFEGKLVTLIANELSPEEGRALITIDGIVLTKFSYKENISIKVSYLDQPIKFKLSQILTQYQGESDVIAHVKRKLRGVKNKEVLFIAEDKPKSEIISELKQANRLTDPVQLCFLIACIQAGEDPSFNSLEAFDFNLLNQDPEWMLNVLYEKQIEKFEEYYRLPWGRLSAMMDVQDLFLPREKVEPQFIDWCKQDKPEERLQFLFDNGLHNHRSPVYKLRKSIERERAVEDALIHQAARFADLFRNTFEWMHGKFPLYSRKSVTVEWFRDLVEIQVETQTGLPPYITSLHENAPGSFKIVPKESANNAYLFEQVAFEDLQAIHSKIVPLGKTLLDGGSYRARSREELKKQGAISAALIKEIDIAQVPDPPEWKASYYQQWRSGEGRNYRIYISQVALPFKYTLDLNGEKKVIGTFDRGKASLYREGDLKKIFIHQNTEKESILSILADHQQELFPGAEAKLVKLLALANPSEESRAVIDQLEAKGLSKKEIGSLSALADRDLLKFIAERQLEPAEILHSLQHSPDTSGNNGEPGGVVFDEPLSEEAHQRLNENLSTVNQLLEQVDAELLNAIVGKMDLIQQLLETENDQSTPNLLIGHIGEILISEWLKQKHPDAEVEWVAQTQSKPEYDIVFQKGGREYLIDVKTTRKSTKDLHETVAFFIKRSQYQFISQNSLDNYFIIRIGLADLGLDDYYASIPKGPTFEEIIAREKDSILDYVLTFLNDPDKIRLLEREKMAFRVSMPGIEGAPF